MSKSKPVAFFVEFLLVLFFFMIIATFVVQAFFHSYQIHKEDMTKQEALLLAQNIVQTWDGSLEPYSKDDFDISFAKDSVYVDVIVSQEETEWIRLPMYGGKQ